MVLFTVIKMKLYVTLVAILCFVHVHSLDENSNIDDELADKGKADKLVACALNKGPCSPYEAKWKEQIRHIVDTHCGSCTPKEKNNVVKFLKYMVEKRPSEWNEFVRVHNISGDEKKHLEDISRSG